MPGRRDYKSGSHVNRRFVVIKLHIWKVLSRTVHDSYINYQDLHRLERYQLRLIM